MTDPFGYLAALKDRDLRREGVLVAEGRLVARRAAERCEPLALLAEPSAAAEAEALAAGRCPVRVLPARELEAYAGFPFHRGLLLAARRPIARGAAELAAFLAEKPSARIAVFPNPTDPENLGAAVRSAAALGWDAVVLGPTACDPYGRRALRCSMGAVLALPLFEADADAFAGLRSAGLFSLAAALEDGAAELGTEAAGVLLAREGALALVFGNEHDGVPAAWRAACAGALRIPQGRNDGEGVDSLNLAAAAALLLWEGRPGRRS